MRYDLGDYIRPFEEMIQILGLNGATTIPITLEEFKNSFDHIIHMEISNIRSI